MGKKERREEGGILRNKEERFVYRVIKTVELLNYCLCCSSGKEGVWRGEGDETKTRRERNERRGKETKSDTHLLDRNTTKDRKSVV